MSPPREDATILSPAQARRLVLRWQGLLGARRFGGAAGVLDYVRQAGCVQYDPVDICGKNAEIVLYSRVGGFTKPVLERLLYKKRVLLDHWDKNMAIVPRGDWPHLARARENFRGWSYSAESRRAVEDAAGAVLARVAALGVACPADLALNEKIDWPWGPARLARATLEYLYFSGALCIHHRAGTQRHYTPAARVLGEALAAAADPLPGDADYHAWHTLRRVAAVGLLWNRSSDAFLGIPGYGPAARSAAFARLVADGGLLPCRVEGLAHTLYLPATAKPVLSEVLAGGQYAARLEFIAPLDALLWDRRLVKALFGFDYKWEIYTPAEKRRYAPYALPVLAGEALAGRVALRAERAASRLVCERFWPEAGFRPTKGFWARLERRLGRFARFNGCETLQVCPGFAPDEAIAPGCRAAGGPTVFM